MQFEKFHGCGNDFILLDYAAEQPFRLKRRWIQNVMNRHYGIGADQLLVLEPSRESDRRLRIFNSDGSEAEMCGNGLRAIGLYLSLKNPRMCEFFVSSRVGRHRLLVHSKRRIEVDLVVPKVESSFELRLDQKQTLRLWPVNVGNPHVVLQCRNRDMLSKIQLLGPLIEKHPYFPNGTNVEFVFQTEAKNLDVRVWERGSQETLACGSGACAAALASMTWAGSIEQRRVRLPGGELIVAWSGPGSVVRLTGPAEHVFSGSLHPSL